MMAVFDKTDLRILKTISIKCSEPITLIARKSRVSRSTADYRLRALEKNKAILKYLAVIDYARLGFSYGRIGVKFINNSPAEQAKAINLLEGKAAVAWFASTQGRYDLAISVLYKSPGDFTDVIYAIKHTCGSNISDLHISIMNKLHFCGNNFFSEEVFSEPITIDFSAAKEAADDLDMKIVGLLSRDSRATTASLCSSLGISAKTLLSRKARLEKIKVIRAYRAVLGRPAFGLNSYHIFWKFSSFDEQFISRFRAHLLGMKEVEYVSEAAGSSDFECYLSTKDEKALYSMLNAVREKYAGLVNSFEHMLILKEHKRF